METAKFATLFGLLVLASNYNCVTGKRAPAPEMLSLRYSIEDLAIESGDCDQVREKCTNSGPGKFKARSSAMVNHKVDFCCELDNVQGQISWDCVMIFGRQEELDKLPDQAKCENYANLTLAETKYFTRDLEKAVKNKTTNCDTLNALCETKQSQFIANSNNRTVSGKVARKFACCKEDSKKNRISADCGMVYGGTVPVSLVKTEAKCDKWWPVRSFKKSDQINKKSGQINRVRDAATMSKASFGAVACLTAVWIARNL